MPQAWSQPCDVSHKLKARYGGMDLPDAKRLKQLEDENTKLKRLLADAMLDIEPSRRHRSEPDGEGY